MFAFVLTASFGGNLRAYLLKPTLTKTIDDISDIVNSGMPWSMQLYGEELDRQLSNAQDSNLVRFWTENVPPDSYGDYQYDKLLLAYQGKGLYVDYNMLASVAIEAGFTRSNGQSELRMSGNIFPWTDDNVYFSWAFHPINPWIARHFLLICTHTNYRFKYLK